jgi:hypothetical protein
MRRVRPVRGVTPVPAQEQKPHEVARDATAWGLWRRRVSLLSPGATSTKICIGPNLPARVSDLGPPRSNRPRGSPLGASWDGRVLRDASCRGGRGIPRRGEVPAGRSWDDAFPGLFLGSDVASPRLPAGSLVLARCCHLVLRSSTSGLPQHRRVSPRGALNITCGESNRACRNGRFISPSRFPMASSLAARARRARFFRCFARQLFFRTQVSS